MRVFLVIGLALGLGLLPAPAGAQEADVLRRELEQVRQQLKALQEQYQRTIDGLSERLQRLEAQPPAPTASSTVTATQASPSTPAAPAPSAMPSALDLARPREPFALYERRGAGQLLFDMGVTGDFAGSLTSQSVEKARVGSLGGEENRFFAREIEVSLFGQIDPYARAEVRFEAGDALEADGSRSLNTDLAEANLTLMAIPWGFQPKLGRMRLRFGYLNEFHQHDRPFIDNPNVLVRFFGEEGLVDNGSELAWVAPLPVYLQAMVGVFDGDNEVAFGADTLREPLVTGRLRTFFEPTETFALQLGVSGATGTTSEDQHASYLGLDAKYKYTPAGWQHPLLSGGGELLSAHRKNKVEAAPGPGADSGSATLTRIRLGPETGKSTEPPTFRTRDAYGYYVWTEVQPWRHWVFGLRYDWTEDPKQAGREWAISSWVSFFTTEFLRFRLGYKHTERSQFLGPPTIDELLFQATFILGAHPADLF